MLDRENLLLCTDAYKPSHAFQLPKGTSAVRFYAAPRKPLHSKYKEFINFGIDYTVRKYLHYSYVKQGDIKEARAIWDKFNVGGTPFPFPWEGFQTIVDKYKGFLPVNIYGLREGVPINEYNTPVLLVECHEPTMPWLPGFIETFLQRGIWYPSTVATNSRNVRLFLEKKYEESVDEDGMFTLDSRLHDFGGRGTTCGEQAQIGGLAHLINFNGTDTMEAVRLGVKMYQMEADELACSIPASEHSTVTSWGPTQEDERRALVNMIEQFGSHPLFAFVSDSYDYKSLVDNVWGDPEIIANIRKRGAMAVVRPDCYDAQTEILTTKGWKAFSSLNYDDKVAQITNEQTIEFVNPTNYVDQYYKGKMIHFFDETGVVNLLVTPNHRVVKKRKKDGQFFVEEAENIKFHDKFTYENSAEIDGLGSLTAIERFYIAFQADGSYSTDGDGNSRKTRPGSAHPTTVRFNFAKKRKFDRLLEICQEAGLKYTTSTEPARPENFQVYVKLNHTPFKTFEWVDIAIVGRQWINQFVEELSYWDATRKTGTRFVYSSRVKNNVMLVQTLCSMAKMRTKYTLDEVKNPMHSNMHILNICVKKSGVDGQRIQKKEVYYEGRIYCVTVPSGMLLVRRKHAVSVSGNSGDPTEMVMYALNSLEKSWGATPNKKKFKVLNGIGVIQGDGMDFKKIRDLYNAVTAAGYSAQNVVVGMGGGLLQKVNRDSMSWSMKMYQCLSSGIWHNIQKKPATQKDKIGWNPNQGISFDNWVTYYRGDAKNALDLPMYLHNDIEPAQVFRDVRKHARAVKVPA